MLDTWNYKKGHPFLSADSIKETLHLPNTQLVQHTHTLIICSACLLTAPPGVELGVEPALVVPTLLGGERSPTLFPWLLRGFLAAWLPVVAGSSSGELLFIPPLAAFSTVPTSARKGVH